MIRPNRPALKWIRRRLDLVLLLVALAVVLAFVFSAVSSSFFLMDDFLFFRLALDRGVGSYIFTTALFQHYSPGRIVSDYLLVKLAPLNFTVALGVQFALLAGLLLTLYAVCTELFGRSRWNIVLMMLFGTSLSLVSIMQWWSQAIFTLPSLLATALTILFFLRYLKTRRRVELGFAVVSYSVGLLFFEKTLLTPLYLALVSVLFLSDQLTPRAVVKVLWRDRWAWLLFAIPTAIHVVNYQWHHFAGDHTVPTAIALSEYLRIVWLRAFAPMVIGQVIPENATTWNEVIVVVAQVVVLGAVAISVLRKRGAWRAWAFWGIVFLVNTLMVGISRVDQFGVGVGYGLRYLPELAFLFILALGFAFYPQRLCRLDSQPAELSGAVPRGASSVRTAHSLRHMLTWSLGVGALILYGASTLTSARQLERENIAQPNRQYIANARAGLSALGREGDHPTVLDGIVPEAVAPSWVSPYNRIQPILSMIARDLQIGSTGKKAVYVGADGNLYRARFERRDGGPTSRLLRSGRGRVAITPSRSGSSLGCMAASEEVVRLTYTPKRLAKDRPLYLYLKAETQARELEMPVFIDRGGGYPAVADHALHLSRGKTETLIELGTVQFPSMRIDNPPGRKVCLTRIEIGVIRLYRPAIG